MPGEQIEITLGLKSNLAQGLAAQKNLVNRWAADMQRTFNAMLTGKGGPLEGVNLDAAGIKMGRLRVTTDQLTNSLRYQAALSKEITNNAGDKLGYLRSEADLMRGNAALYTRASIAQAEEIERTRQLFDSRRQLSRALYEAKSVEMQGRQASVAASQAQLSGYQQQLRAMNLMLDAQGRLRYAQTTGGARAGRYAPFSALGGNTTLLAQARQAQGILRNAEQMALTPFNQMTSPRISAITNGLNAWDASMGNLARDSATTARMWGEIARKAQSMPQAMPAGIAQIQSESKGLYRSLRMAGLGGQIGETQPEMLGAAMNQQGAKVRITRDMVRDVTRATVSWRDHAGVVKSVTAEYDKYGRVLTRWGGQFSGISQSIRQVGRDILKVAEWTIATTLVIGGLRMAMGAFSVITELDKSLRQFGITAQLSKEQTDAFFGSLADVAVATATPIEELVKAADDIALATRKAGQSSDEWRDSIISLTEAVGILTNLSGMDTVSATDLLTSTMKQLGLEASNMIGVLNKVTAVAGGQSNAITDIAKGLGVMGEASSQAGLSLDQAIATIQVLGQVTSKSAAEVATSFKNLVGSIDSKASIKALTEYGIAVRDEQGNMRNFLDIYREIQSKISQGIIPAGRVKELVKAISGGPRRAPDAAALLTNVEQIYLVQERSVSATNEALITNAKVLDTVSAKVVQLQNQFKILTFEKFGSSLRDTFEAGITFLNTFLSILNGIPNSTIAAAVQLGILAIGIKVLIGLGRAISGVGANMIASFRLMGESAAYAAGQVMGLTSEELRLIAATKGAQGMQLGLGLMPGMVGPDGKPVPERGNFRRNLGKAALIGGAMAIPVGAQIAGGGGDLLGAVPSMLQAAGLATAMLPVPGWAQAIGATMFVAGTAIQMFGGSSKKAAEDVGVLAEELNTLLSTNKDASKTVVDLTKQQENLEQQINRLTSMKKLTNDEQLQLNDLYTQWASTAAQASGANTQYADSLQRIQEIANQLAKDDKSWQKLGFGGAAIASLQSRGSPEERSLAAQKLAQFILGQTNAAFRPSNFTPGQPSSWVTNNVVAPFATATGSTMAGGETIRRFTNKAGQMEEKVVRAADLDLTKLTTNAEELYRIWDKGTGEQKLFFDITSQNLGFIQEAINTLSKNGAEDLDKIIAKFQEMAAASDMMTYAMGKIEAQRAFITASAAVGTPGFEAETVNQMNATLTGYQDLIKQAGKLPAATLQDTFDRRGGGFSQQEALSMINRIVFQSKGPQKGLPVTSIDISQAKDLIQLYPEVAASIAELTKGREKDTETMTAGFLVMNGWNVKGYTDKIVQAIQANEEFQKALEDLKEAAAAVDTEFADFATGVMFDVQSKNLTAAQGNSILNYYQPLFDNKEAILSTLAEIEERINQDFEDTNPVIQDFLESISKISPMFADAADQGLDAFVTKLVDLASKNLLTKDSITEVNNALITLLTLIGAIDGKKAEAEIYITVKTNMDKFKESLTGTPLLTNPKLRGELTEILKEEATKNTEEATKNQNKSLMDQVLEAIRAITSPSSLVDQGGGGGRGVQTQTVDITKELVPMLPGVIDKIIANATKLQAALPGEAKANKDAIVAILQGTKVLRQVEGVGAEYLRKAIEELTEVEKARLAQEQKADMLQRIRVGMGSFAALANVPLNRATGVSVGGPQGPITVNLNINGQILTPAQAQQIGEAIGAQINSVSGIN